MAQMTLDHRLTGSARLDAAQTGGTIHGTQPLAHTMGAALAKYVLPKVPADVLASGLPVHVEGATSVLELSEGKAGATKPFNWRRPKFVVGDDAATCRVTPGSAYALHYAHLIATAAAISGSSTTVTWSEPAAEASRAFIAGSLPELPRADVVILGYVERLEVGAPADPSWHHVPGWGWRLHHLGGRRVLMLGCEFSYWGDLAGQTVRELYSRGVTDYVVYVGKLGALHPEIVPNSTLATGTTSMLETGPVQWQGRLAEHARPGRKGVLWGARHVTVPSVVQETTAWLAESRLSFDLVDPEIGHMGLAAVEAGAEFDYLHLVTDCLGHDYGVGLYDERSRSVHSDRKALTRSASAILSAVILGS